MKKLLKNTVFLRVVFLIIALGIAGFGTLKLKQYFSSNLPTQEVLVAKVDIQPYSEINLNDLGYLKLPVGSILPGSIQNYGLVVGKHAKTTIYRGEQIFPGMIGSNSPAESSNSSEVAVPTDIVRSVGMEIKPGDRVDLYFLPVAKQAVPNAPQTIQQATLIARGALVVNVLNSQDTSVFNAAASSTSSSSNSTTNPNAPAVVVLRVDSSMVQPIVTAIGNGLIYMAKTG